MAWEAAMGPTAQDFDLFQKLHLGIVVHAPDSSILFCNRRASELLGLSEDQLLGRVAGDPSWCFVHEDGRPMSASELPVNRALATRASLKDMVLGIKWAGQDQPAWVLVSAFTALAASGAVEYVLVNFFDISRSKQAEQNLRASESLLHAVIDNAAVGIAQVSITGRFLQINPEFSRIIGYAQDEVLSHGFTFQQITLPEDLPADLEHVNRLLRGDGNRYGMEKRYIRKGGVIVWVSLSVFLQRDAEGHPLYFISAVQDIAERKQAEAELEQHRHHLEQLVAKRTAELASARDAAEAANRAKSIFLANMSHEIRTPLNGILGLAYLLRRGEVTPKQAEWLDTIDRSGHHLLEVINSVLELAKIDAGKVVLRHADFTLAEMLQDVTAVVGDALKAKGLALRIEMADVPHALNGDPARLSQAVVNYLANAIKFTEHGSITFAGHLIEETASDYLLRFEVADSGVGIPKAELDRLFTPFHQVDESLTRPVGGTGLGLSITKRLAELMGGEVGVQSSLGAGSTFWLTARLGKASVAQDPFIALPPQTAEGALRRDHRGARILLAEDEPVNQEVTLAMLRGAGLAVDLAVDGREAVRLATQNDYAVILMDMQMPVMDGLAATRAIRALPGPAATPIIALTANAFDDDRSASRAAGMVDFVTKPVRPEVLFSMILQWLRHRQHWQEQR
jgi:PAS domain S-box-containing protein